MMDEDGTTRDKVFERYKAYVRHATKHDKLEQHVTDWIRERSSAGEKLTVLDIGAGTGRLAKAVLKAGNESGITIDLVAIEPCKTAVKELHAALDEFRQDGNEIRVLETVFEDVRADLQGRFDLVLASHVSYYFADLDGFVGDVVATLKSDGEAIFVATSTSIVQNSVYRSLYRQLRQNTSLPRTLESDGRFSFGESLELALIEQNADYTKTSLTSSIDFQLAEIDATIDALEAGTWGPVLEAMAFLWRYPNSAMLTIRNEWLLFLNDLKSRGSPLNLVYDDIILRVGR